MPDNKTEPELILGIIGSVDFNRRLSAAISDLKGSYRVCSGTMSNAWSDVLSEKPHLLVIEIGIQLTLPDIAWFRQFLSQIRERFDRQIFIALALTAPEKLGFGGDLLFASEHDLQPSPFVDTFLVQPPIGIPTQPDLASQLDNCVKLVSHERQRIASGGVAVPALGNDGWVQSLADPQSRDLWMLWLPRYASYTNENPIIVGPTGSGKTRLAHALHLLSARSGPFVSITPRDFSSSELVQAELFGAVSGAYTGAVDKWGLVNSAEGGTLFIDELQSIDKDLQGKLITFIENKIYRRVGSAETTKADVRFVFASNRSIDDMVASDTLRDDFAYRLERVQLELLPLQKRRLDIGASLAYSLAKIRRQRPQTNPIYGVTGQAFRQLFSQSWPGNLRQLENTVAQLCEITDISGGNTIDEAAVSKVFKGKLSAHAMSAPEVVAQAAIKTAQVALGQDNITTGQAITHFCEALRAVALEASNGEETKAAELMAEDAKLIDLYYECYRG